MKEIIPTIEEELERDRHLEVPLERTVYPSTEKSVCVIPDADYGGAHRYVFCNSLGFNYGKTEYTNSRQVIQFVQKNNDGSIIPGIQSEQLVIALLDRTIKLNARFPSENNLRMIYALETFLQECEWRVKERVSRGVMGKLKK